MPERTCQIVEVAKELVGQVEAQELPSDFDPGDLWYDEILAVIRHEYTNYEELLNKLPLCVDIWDAGQCVWQSEDDFDLECPFEREAHDLLKWAAKDAAEEVYQRWKAKSARLNKEKPNNG